MWQPGCLGRFKTSSCSQACFSLVRNAAEDPSIPPVVMNLPGGLGAPCEDDLVPERFITSDM